MGVSHDFHTLSHNYYTRAGGVLRQQKTNHISIAFFSLLQGDEEPVPLSLSLRPYLRRGRWISPFSSNSLRNGSCARGIVSSTLYSGWFCLPNDLYLM